MLDRPNQILLQHRKDNPLWGFPGGAMELGEALEETARRELREETGLEALDLTLLEVFSGQQFFYEYPHGDQVYNLIAAYIVTKTRGVLRACDEESLSSPQSTLMEV